MPAISNPLRVSLISASVGIALIAVLATYFRRKRRRPPLNKITKETPARKSEDRVDSAPQSGFLRSKRGRSPTVANVNGDVLHRTGSVPQEMHLRSYGGSSTSVNTTDSKLSGLSSSTLTDAQSKSLLNPEQLCDLGMEALQTAISHWEDALEKLEEQERSLESGDHVVLNVSLQNQLQQLLHRAYNIQDHYEQKLLTQVNANVAVDSAISALTEMDRAYEEKRRSRTASLQDDMSSDQDSFVSAIDMADLSDLEDHKDSYHHLVLYEAGLLELTHGSVPYRTLRTKMVNCLSDTEFLSKLFCVRLAFSELFKDDTIRSFFAESGKQMISDLLIQADRDPEDFQMAYDMMMQYISNEENWTDMEIELKGRGVKELNFFDVVIDFILFDAFDDLESPPSSVTSVVQNRWLSNGFKETALSTAVWSVLKAKRRMLRFQKGFIAHFYAISEHTSPVLAWGFLGPDGHLKDLCNYFKNEVLGLMRDIFSFDKVRYTSLPQLSDDILRLAKKRVAVASAKLSS